jgi:hypothetical protein
VCAVQPCQARHGQSGSDADADPTELELQQRRRELARHRRALEAALPAFAGKNGTRLSTSKASGMCGCIWGWIERGTPVFFFFFFFFVCVCVDVVLGSQTETLAKNTPFAVQPRGATGTASASTPGTGLKNRAVASAPPASRRPAPGSWTSTMRCTSTWGLNINFLWGGRNPPSC